MSMSVLEPESMSDALFSCVYRWINGHPIDKKEASAAAARHRDKATTFGALAQKLKSLVLGAGATYESLCESGLILTSSEKQKNHAVLLTGPPISKASIAPTRNAAPSFIDGGMVLRKCSRPPIRSDISGPIT